MRGHEPGLLRLVHAGCSVRVYGVRSSRDSAQRGLPSGSEEPGDAMESASSGPPGRRQQILFRAVRCLRLFAQTSGLCCVVSYVFSGSAGAGMKLVTTRGTLAWMLGV